MWYEKILKPKENPFIMDIVQDILTISSILSHEQIESYLRRPVQNRDTDFPGRRVGEDYSSLTGLLASGNIVVANVQLSGSHFYYIELIGNNSGVCPLDELASDLEGNSTVAELIRSSGPVAAQAVLGIKAENQGVLLIGKEKQYFHPYYNPKQEETRIWSVSDFFSGAYCFIRDSFLCSKIKDTYAAVNEHYQRKLQRVPLEIRA